MLRKSIRLSCQHCERSPQVSSSLSFVNQSTCWRITRLRTQLTYLRILITSLGYQWGTSQTPLSMRIGMTLILYVSSPLKERTNSQSICLPHRVLPAANDNSSRLEYPTRHHVHISKPTSSHGAYQPDHPCRTHCTLRGSSKARFRMIR